MRMLRCLKLPDEIRRSWAKINLTGLAHAR
jgi:hypothetical protein